jgi:2-methylisocitrate lyase-like PEP mutase family enzyme
LCSSVTKPVSVMVSSRNTPYTVAKLAELGVRRISIGPALSLAALGAFMRAAREMREHGTFTFTNDSPSFSEVNEIMAPNT